MNFVPFLVLFLFAIVFARTENDEYDAEMKIPTPLQAANLTKMWLNCDNNKKDGFEETMSAIHNCIKQSDTDSKIADLTKKCYPEMPFPATAKEAREWHCERSIEEIAESIECENSALEEMDIAEEMDSDESSEAAMTIRMCVWDTVPAGDYEDKSDEDKSDEIEEKATE